VKGPRPTAWAQDGGPNEAPATGSVDVKDSEPGDTLQGTFRVTLRKSDFRAAGVKGTETPRFGFKQRLRTHG